MNRLNEKVDAKYLPKLMLHYGFRLFTKADKRFNVNILNIRSRETKAGKFDDVQVVFWFWEGKLEWKKYDVTTDPGIPYLLRPMHRYGAAVVAPGQYTDVWRLGKHRGKYDALVQTSKISVFRDNDKDNTVKTSTLHDAKVRSSRDMLSASRGYMTSRDANHFDRHLVYRGLFGINCHRASKYGLVERVGKYSAGCCVHHDPEGYKEFIKICKESAINFSNSFTATWITEKDYDEYINTLINTVN